MVFFCKQKTAYVVRFIDWSSDVCSSDLARRPARPLSDLQRAVGRDLQREHTGSARDHLLKLTMRVEMEPHRDAEPITQRRRQQALPCRRAEEREFGQVDPPRACRRPFADPEVE